MSNIMDIKYGMLDENQTRIVATLVVITIVAYLFLGYIGLLMLLAYHFFIGLCETPLLSPLEVIATKVSLLFSNKKNKKNMLEKEFATHLALIVVTISIVLAVLEYSILSSISILLLAVWKMMEMQKNVCFGCKLYEFIERKGIKIISL
ncbi:MAG: hypothetical protein ACI9TV_002286 [Sulfurimonas sp.]|jgi:hypothetical protein|uniref:DUF4395 family protein n=1 Tax=Sulfurimonas sp. TaxID=2022749 RepID=UPI0039E60A75